MKKDLIRLTEKFVKESFIARPNFSFNDWTIMYNHAVMVEKFAVKIASDMKCDKIAIAISALLHDIGKTADIDEKILYKQHSDFNLPMSKQFLEGLELPHATLEKIEKMISYQGNSVEMKIIKDADAIAFSADKKLYMAFLNWAKKNKMDVMELAKKKLDKYNALNFPKSSLIGEKYFERMKKDYSSALRKISNR